MAEAPIDSPIQSPIQSPCVKLCTLDSRAGLCLGCGRTIDEIAHWISMSTAQRAQVTAQLPARLTARRQATAAPATG